MPSTAARPAVRPARPGVSGRDVKHTAIAGVVALGLVEVLRVALHVESTILLGALAYGLFVVALVAARVAMPATSVTRRPAPARRITSAPRVAAAPESVIPFTETETMPAPVAGEPRLDLTSPTPVIEADTPTQVIPLPTGPEPDPDQPMRRKVLTPNAVAELAFPALAALALAWIVRVLQDQHSVVGTTCWWYAGFLAISYLLVLNKKNGEAAIDHVMLLVIWSAGAVTAGVLSWMIGFLVARGLPRLSLSFFTQDLSTVGPLSPGGGALHAIIGTLEQVGIATIVVVPISVLTAVYLHEMKGRLSKPVRFIVDAMSGLPSIVAGLLVFSVWVNGRGYSGLAGAAALVVLMIPTVTRTSEEILRTIPDSLREASLALGAPQWRVIVQVVIPTALTGLVTAVILGIARAVGETAPMLLTALGTDSTNVNPLHGAQSDLPLFVYKLIRVPNKTQNDRAWAGMLVLVMLVIVLFATARIISNRGLKKLGRAR